MGFSFRGLSWLQSRNWIWSTQVSGAAPRGLCSCGSRSGEHRLNSCGARTSLLCSMWNLPEPGIKPKSPAPAGGFYTTEPLGRPSEDFFFFFFLDFFKEQFKVKSCLSSYLNLGLTVLFHESTETEDSKKQ